MAKLSKAIDAVRAAAEKINKRALPNTRWLSVAVDARGAELPGICISAETHGFDELETRVALEEIRKFFPDATLEEHQAFLWTVVIENSPDDWGRGKGWGGKGSFFSVEFAGGDEPLRSYGGFAGLFEKFKLIPKLESSGRTNANASEEPSAILHAISKRHGWTITHTVKETAERIGVSHRAIWDWLNGSAVPIAQNKLALYYCQFEPGTEVEIRGEDPEARMHARAVFQAGLKPKLVAGCNAED
ncbi:MAG: hypothetical protein LUE08_05950 [Akkermansiaceae bacterium]|nr:hypothetical protein [Akkermansiaceae bacterium]